MKLVIIAAGLGSRLSPVSSGTPKLLLPILGQRLIDKILANCIEADIKNIVVVTGYNNHIIEDHLKTIQTSIKIETAYNPDWELANGVSVLAAQNLIPVGEDFMISMSDHYYNSDLLKTIKTHADDQTVASVGADYNISEIHDIDDGMKLKIDKESNLIRAMSKNLFEYDAIDCGIFKCRYAFFDYLIKAKAVDFFVPQKRERLIIVGFKHGILKRDFVLIPGIEIWKKVFGLKQCEGQTNVFQALDDEVGSTKLYVFRSNQNLISAQPLINGPLQQRVGVDSSQQCPQQTELAREWVRIEWRRASG